MIFFSMYCNFHSIYCQRFASFLKFGWSQGERFNQQCKTISCTCVKFIFVCIFKFKLNDISKIRALNISQEEAPTHQVPLSLFGQDHPIKDIIRKYIQVKNLHLTNNTRKLLFDQIYSNVLNKMFYQFCLEKSNHFVTVSVYSLGSCNYGRITVMVVRPTNHCKLFFFKVNLKYS